MALLRVGNIYKCKGGNKTSYWVVVGIAGASVSMVGYDQQWRVTSAVSYGRHVFECSSGLFRPRQVIGFMPEVANFKFKIPEITLEK